MPSATPKGQVSGSRCPRHSEMQRGGRGSHWGPGSEERRPDFRAFGGGGGGALASLRTGSGGATCGADMKTGMSLLVCPRPPCSLSPTFCFSFESFLVYLHSLSLHTHRHPHTKPSIKFAGGKKEVHRGPFQNGCHSEVTSSV